MAAPMDDSTADAPAIPVGLKKILIKDREFINVANSWVDKGLVSRQANASWNVYARLFSNLDGMVVVGQPGTAYEKYPSHEEIFVEEKVLKHKYVPLIPLAKLIIRMIIAHDLYDIPESKGKDPKKIESLEKKFRALKAAVGSLYTEAVSWRDILYTKKVKFVNQKVSSALWNRIGAKGSTMAAPMDDSTADAPAIPVGLKKILIKDREFLNVANSWVDKVKQQKVSSALWNRIGAKGSNCPFSVRTKFGKQTNIAALFKKTTKLYGKLASSKGTKSREMIVTAHKFKKALQGCFASRAQVALIDHLFSDSGYQKSEIDAISRLQSSILKIKPRRSATYDVCKVKYSTGRTGMCALDMITEHPTKITKVFGLSKDILPTSDKFSRPKLGYLQNGKPAAIVISMPILWFTVAMKGSPSYVNGGSS
ncbi:hypothetical protein HELRODRAFT_184473, partial [Helobdella robusta]|uniref:Uncharacterized protein n=1 Tax=Helobdella robusta TaxID=6412 RepID=T1FLA1_HELRO